jgi:hypothetical protein
MQLMIRLKQLMTVLQGLRQDIIRRNRQHHLNHRNMMNGIQIFGIVELNK